MELSILKPRKALNKAFLKVKANRSDIELFKKNLIRLIDTINEHESEEFHKNLVSDFLKNTYYGGKHFINTKGRNDLVIHNGTTASSTVGVIIEAKQPAKKAEMLRPDNINTKAFQELVYYYLRERITLKNLEIKHLIATNIYEWYIFDAHLFEREFAQNKKLVKQFIDFEEGRLSGNTTDFFYKEIAAPAIEEINHEICFTHFDIRDYDKPLRNDDKTDDNVLIALFKLLSPEHLLKLPFANDSNSLDKAFYTELLHIIGLTETKEGGKKLIQRKEKGQRNAASLMESAIVQLDNLDKLSRMDKPSQYGDTTEERLFNVALELSITWINRILFLKLLEAQLIKYHKGDKTYAFLNTDKVKGFDDLNTLFFQVLAKLPAERNEEVRLLFAHVPYLNSSLFEPTDMEHAGLFISQLNDGKLPLLSNSVIKDNTGKKRLGELTAVEYMFEFLNAYDFSSEGSEEIQEDNKRLINASVLGLIFEKINGYKDGSFFTPGFITMYMCRETIRRAVLQKFNDVKGWNCNTLHDLYDRIESDRESRLEANILINSLKLCDPAVGSGHFLVSALNEIIAIKSELRILSDREGKRLKEYTVEVENDELIVTDEDGHLFEYNPTSKESQRVQETLFHEKQTIIENCLFGVDLNPNSVKICRLRLWIELLKNAYYRTPSNSPEGGELETLPNIDINIKCGNSLISRYALDADIKQIAKSTTFSISTYQIAVQTYKTTSDKNVKKEIQGLIKLIKENYIKAIQYRNPLIQKCNKLKQEYDYKFPENGLFLHEPDEPYSNDAINRENEKQKIADSIAQTLNEIEAEKTFYERNNAFEWRFEFPEVLNDKGDFMGFDVVIGNPPYGVKFTDKEKSFYKEAYAGIHVRTPESFNYFLGLTSKISNQNGLCNFIIPSSFLSQIEFEKTRKVILNNYKLYCVINLGDAIFDDVATPTCIIGYSKTKANEDFIYSELSSIDRVLLTTVLGKTNKYLDSSAFIDNDSFTFIFKPYKTILDKCYKFPTLKEVAEEVATGVSSGLDKAYVYSAEEVANNLLECSLLKKLIVGGEINRYLLSPISNKMLVYITSEHNISEYPNIENQIIKYKEPLSKRREAANGQISWYSLNWPRRQKLFDNPKILIRQTANKIMAAYDEDKWYCLKSGLIVQLPENSDLHYYYLLALLNSKLLDFLYHDLVNEDNRIFPEVKPIQLFKLPIFKATKEEQIDFIAKVQQVIELKTSNQDTIALESEIDRLVYQLYGLTEEEVKIVEGEK